MLRRNLTVLLLAVAVVLAGPALAAKKERQAAQSDVSYLGRVNLNLAQNYLRQGDLKTALEKVSHALKSDPGSGEVQVMAAMVQDRIGNADKAEDHFRRALKLSPRSGPILNAHAVWLCRNGHAEEADAEFRLALEDPFYTQTAQALLNAGRCALQSKNLPRADANFRQVLAKHPNDQTALQALASVHLAMGDPLRARAFLQRREGLGTMTAEALALAAEIEQAAGDSAAAARYRQRLVENYPEYVPTTREGSSSP